MTMMALSARALKLCGKFLGSVFCLLAAVGSTPNTTLSAAALAGPPAASAPWHSQAPQHDNPFLPLGTTAQTLSPPTPAWLQSQTAHSSLKLVFLLDNSGSMRQNDPQNHRFTAITKLFKQSSVSRYVAQVAVIVFSNQAQLFIPFTSAANFPRVFAKRLAAVFPSAARTETFFSQGKTDLDLPFQTLKRLLSTQAQPGQTAVILLSDGVSSTQYQGTHQFLVDARIPVFTIGYHQFMQSAAKRTAGGQQAASFNEAFLRTLAAANNGEFWPASPASIRKVYSKAVKNVVTAVSPLLAAPKRHYAPNELIVLGYQLPKHNTEAPLRRCTLSGSTQPQGQRRSSPQPLSLVKSTTVKLQPLSQQFFFAPLPIGVYSMKLTLRCAAGMNVTKRFTLTSSSEHAPVTIAEPVILRQRAAGASAATQYLQLSAVSPVTVLHLQYYAADAKTSAAVVQTPLVVFPLSPYTLKRGDEQLQPYQVVQTLAAASLASTGVIELVSSQGHFLFHAKLQLAAAPRLPAPLRHASRAVQLGQR